MFFMDTDMTEERRKVQHRREKAVAKRQRRGVSGLIIYRWRN